MSKVKGAQIFTCNDGLKLSKTVVGKIQCYKSNPMPEKNKPTANFKNKQQLKG